MKIIEIRIDIFSNIKTFHFEDDTSVDIDIDTYEVIDADGMATLSKSKKAAIEKKINKTLID